MIPDARSKEKTFNEIGIGNPTASSFVSNSDLVSGGKYFHFLRLSWVILTELSSY